MFGFSIGKLLLLLAIGVGAWFLWRRARNALSARGQPPQRQQQPRSKNPVTEAMVKCGRCGAYVAESAGRCERADCPRPA
jgi:hypothetical protein